jgi:hypothetical protein
MGWYSEVFKRAMQGVRSEHARVAMARLLMASIFGEAVTAATELPGIEIDDWIGCDRFDLKRGFRSVGIERENGSIWIVGNEGRTAVELVEPAQVPAAARATVALAISKLAT